MLMTQHKICINWFFGFHQSSLNDSHLTTKSVGHAGTLYAQLSWPLAMQWHSLILIVMHYVQQRAERKLGNYEG
jgi:hypothetical protein